MLDCVGLKIKIGHVVEIPQHPSNCFVHDINEARNFAVIENEKGYFCNVDRKDIHVLEEIVLPQRLRNK